MPNWIEATLAFLKKQISLRFAMFWLLSWMVLLLFIPADWAEFIDSGISKWSIPYVGTAIFLIPVSFFVSLLVKKLYHYFFSISEEKQDIKNINKAKKILRGLSTEEWQIINYIFEKGSTEYMADCSMASICNLVDKKIIYGLGGRSPSSHTYYLYDLYEDAIVKIVAESNR
ncbi:super-infection exclusion protein B [Providencia manganoxydans]|uniref:super-infection exclusion protein B n=1 Tax=Providencia manganoxydans TaxID=2923283 RepID=UPI0032DA43F8